MTDHRVKPGSKIEICGESVEVLNLHESPNEWGCVVQAEDGHCFTLPVRWLIRAVEQDEKRACRDNSPSWFTGRWRDWHRGHGCNKDDGQPRTAEGAAEIERGQP